MDRRKERRFPVSFIVGARQESREGLLGLTKDFSRGGLRAVFDDFKSEPNSYLDLEIQRPHDGSFFPARGEVRWKRRIEGKWEVGFRLKDLIPGVKAEILEYGYNRWLRDKVYSQQNS